MPAPTALRRVLGAVLLVALAACSSAHDAARRSTAAPSRASVTTGATSSSPVPSTASAPRGADWATYGGSAGRTGMSAHGPASAAVTARWSSERLDGDVYAQPLIVGDRVIVSTANDSVYALDVRSGTEVWHRRLGDAVPASDLPCGDVDPVGITGTPVADVAHGRLYVAAMVQRRHHQLFALDLARGTVVASVRVDAPGADPRVHNQRAALTLANGRVYVPFGGRFGDCGDYHGRVVAAAITAHGFGAVTSYTLPTRRQGGFWTPPGATLGTDGSLYLASGNSSSSGAYDYGNSVVRLGADLRLVDSFAPRDWAALNAGDTDIGSVGPTLIGGTRVFEVGKAGIGYVLDAAHLGGIGGELHSGDVCNGSGAFGAVAHDGPQLYVPCSNGLVAVRVTGDSFSIGLRVALDRPGAPVITPSTVWVVDTRAGELVAIDRRSGAVRGRHAVGGEPSRFVSPALGARLVVVPGDRSVHAFG